MTENSNKIRALILSALMVFSVFAGTIAFAGTAAAANSVSGASYSANPVDESSSYNGATVSVTYEDVTTSDGNTDTFHVNIPNEVAQAGSLSVSSVTVTGDNGDYSSSLSSSPVDGLDEDGVMDTLQVTTDTDNGVENDTVTVQFTYSFSTPTVGSDTDYNYRASVLDSDGDDISLGDAGTDLTVSQTGTETQNYQIDGDTVELVYSGQEVNVTGLQSNTEYQLRSVDESSGTTIESSSFEGPYSTNAEGKIVGIDTSDLGSGDYYITGPGLGTQTTSDTFEIVEQTFTAEFDESSVDNEGSTTVDLNIDSNRNNYNVIVTSENFDYDDSELDDIFGEEMTTVESGEYFVITGVSGDFATNFSGIDEGQYNFTFTVTDTGVSDTASVNVSDVGAGEADLAESTTTVEQGGYANFTVELNDAATGGDATVLIGDESGDGYQANITVTDANEDGEVQFAFNTYTAGDVDTTGNVVTLVGSSDDGEDEIAFTAADDQTDLSDILDSGDYIVSVGTDADPVDVLDSPDNVGTLVISERPAPEQQLWRTSTATLDAVQTAAGDDDLDAASAITDAVENGQVTQTDTLALDPDGSQDDVMVHQLSAPGLSGLMDAAQSGEVTSEFSAALEADTTLTAALVEQNPGSNQEAATLYLSELDEDALTVIADGEGEYYIFVDYSQVADTDYENKDNTFEDGTEVTAGVTVTDDRLLDIPDSADEDETESYWETTLSNFSVEEPEGSFDLNGDDLVAITASENATVTGTTNVAPGTEFTVRLQSTGDTEPRFFETQTVTVQADGTFNATFDLSGQSTNDTFTASVRQAGFSLSEDGVIVDSISEETPTETATPEPTETATPEPTETATPEPTETDAPDETDEPTETPEDDTTTTTTPGFGVAVALVALLAAALLAGRRE